MKSYRSEPYLVVSAEKLLQADEAGHDFDHYFPTYLRQPTTFRCSRVKYAWFTLLQWLLRLALRIMLRPRHGPVEALDQSEVDAVYDREAESYDRKHHLTTRGKDTTWRRYAGWQIASSITRTQRSVTVLDLCTGTGLTVQEIVNVASPCGVSGTIIGLDYNRKMLRKAQARNFEASSFNVSFVRGDATDLLSKTASPDDFTRFSPETFDAVTQVFGIGGISNPVAVFKGVISILKEHGMYVIVDMHAPISDQPGEWPFLFRWWRMPLFETITYHQSTIPLALNRLWGWRDPTLDFYLLPLVTVRDDKSQWWGFEIVSRQVESERWWLALPIMPVARTVVRKVKIGEEEAQKRTSFLELALSSLA